MCVCVCSKVFVSVCVQEGFTPRLAMKDDPNKGSTCMPK